MNTTISDAEAITRLSAIGLHLTRYSLITIIILGLFGNILNVLVFRQPKLRSNPCSFYLISAAYANLIWIIAGPFTRMISTFGLDLSERIAILCKIRHFIIYSLQSLSIMYVALATIDRFLISSMKVEYRRLSSLQNAHRLTIIISIVYCLIFINMFYCLNVTGTSPLLACTTTTSSICGLFNEIARLVLLAFIPTLLILIFGFGTIQNIKKSRKNIIPQQNAHHNIRRKDRQLVQMVISQIVLITIAYLPHTIQRIYLVATLHTSKTNLRSRIELLWGQVTLIIASAESALSFYIYATSGGSLFRKTLKELFHYNSSKTKN